MRLFIAIEIPEDIMQAIAKVQRQLRAGGADANWTRPEGIHLTLKFLGEVPEAKVPEITAAMSEAAHGAERLSLTVEGAGAFPNRKSPRVLWLGVTGDTGNLAALQSSVEDAMAALGFEREARMFSPHLTLARIRFPRPRDNWQQLITGISNVKLGGFEAGHVSLMQSELRREGAVYTEVGRVELKRQETRDE
jgi:2'-5' RNA ligase